MMKNRNSVWLPLLLSIFLVGCEKTIELNLPKPEQQLVIQGQIEPDSFAFISISQNSPYFEPVNLQSIAGSLINNAVVTVRVDDVIDTLEPIFALKHFTVFNYRGTKIKGEVGKSYELNIYHEQTHLQAVTTIPFPVALDSLWHRTKADLVAEAGQFQPSKRDSELVSLYFRYNDPDTLGNSVRAFTKRNGESQWSSDFSSVYNDELINGNTVDFILRRGKEVYLFNDSTTFEEFGYFERGDTIDVKWCAIDRPHYLFWLTLNSARGGSGNPFATPTIVATNINSIRGKKGLGVWGGYSSVHYRYVVLP